MEIREANKRDLEQLLLLYTQLHGNALPDFDKNLESLWQEILEDKNHHIIVACEDGKIISSCVLIVVPNLTQNQRPYALIENVVTDEKYRKQGYATKVLNFARDIAQENRCYKIMLMTSAKDEDTLNFYIKAGYNKDDKTAFIQWL